MKINFRNGDIQTVTINNYFDKASDTGELSEEIRIPCSKEFSELVGLVCKFKGQEIGELGHKCLVKGIAREIENIFLKEPYFDKSLREILKKK